MKVSKRLRFAVFARDDFTCQYCGRQAPDVVLHVDHVLARARGGSDTMANLVTACLACNLGKSDTQVAPRNVEMTDDGFPWCWIAPEDDTLQVALCDPAFYPELVI